MAGEFVIIANQVSASPNTVEVMFSASASTMITAWSATNDTGVNHSYKAYIYDSAGASSGANIPRKFVTALRGEHLGPTMIGQIVPKGGTIRVESSSANSIMFRATGRLV